MALSQAPPRARGAKFFLTVCRARAPLAGRSRCTAPSPRGSCRSEREGQGAHVQTLHVEGIIASNRLDDDTLAL